MDACAGESTGGGVSCRAGVGTTADRICRGGGSCRNGDGIGSAHRRSHPRRGSTVVLAGPTQSSAARRPRFAAVVARRPRRPSSQSPAAMCPESRRRPRQENVAAGPFQKGWASRLRVVDLPPRGPKNDGPSDGSCRSLSGSACECACVGGSFFAAGLASRSGVFIVAAADSAEGQLPRRRRSRRTRRRFIGGCPPTCFAWARRRRQQGQGRHGRWLARAQKRRSRPWRS